MAGICSKLAAASCEPVSNATADACRHEEGRAYFILEKETPRRANREKEEGEKCFYSRGAKCDRIGMKRHRSLKRPSMLCR